MRRTSLSLILALAMVAGACGDDSPRVVGLDDLRLHKVAGDNQAAPVASTAPSTVIVPAGLSAQVSTGPGDLFDQVLVVRLAEEGKMTMSGATVKPGTMIHWDVPDEGCGKPVGGSTAVDDSAYSINRWRKGTKAGDCRMRACRILEGGNVSCDQTFVAVQKPGAPVKVEWGGPGYPTTVGPGDTLDISAALTGGRDIHGNLTSVESAVNNIPASTAWTAASSSGQVCSPGGVRIAHRDGWLAVVPDEIATWQPTKSGIAGCLHIFVDDQFVDMVPMRLK